MNSHSQDSFYPSQQWYPYSLPSTPAQHPEHPASSDLIPADFDHQQHPQRFLTVDHYPQHPITTPVADHHYYPIQHHRHHQHSHPYPHFLPTDIAGIKQELDPMPVSYDRASFDPGQPYQQHSSTSPPSGLHQMANLCIGESASPTVDDATAREETWDWAAYHHQQHRYESSRGPSEVSLCPAASTSQTAAPENIHSDYTRETEHRDHQQHRPDDDDLSRAQHIGVVVVKEEEQDPEAGYDNNDEYRQHVPWLDLRGHHQHQHQQHHHQDRSQIQLQPHSAPSTSTSHSSRPDWYYQQEEEEEEQILTLPPPLEQPHPPFRRSTCFCLH